jgi:hypothetical protein
VPSLQDWKTAWDFVHFEGFLGARMSLQFTWMGSDSALAAPLVLDLVRWADLAARRRESGPMPHTACYFKAPFGAARTTSNRQYAELLAYAEACLRGSARPRARRSSPERFPARGGRRRPTRAISGPRGPRPLAPALTDGEYVRSRIVNHRI